MRRAAKVDGNHRRIIRFATEIGIVVADTSRLGEGFPDCVWSIGRPGVNVLVEIKDGSKPPSQRQLTADEAEFRERWPGPYEIVETDEDVLRVREKYLG